MKLSKEEIFKRLKFEWKPYGYYLDKFSWIRENPYGYDYHIRFIKDGIVEIYHTITDIYEHIIFKGPFDYLSLKEFLVRKDKEGKEFKETFEIPKCQNTLSKFMSKDEAEKWNIFYRNIQNRLISW